MNIDGISEQTLSRFINLGWMSNYADIYQLKNHIHEIASLEGFGDKSASKMMRAIEKSREVDPQKLLYALSIPLCGIDVCKRLLAAYPFEQLISTELLSQGAELEMIPGIGPEKSAAFINWFSNEENRRVVDLLLKEVHVSQNLPKQKGTKCEGMNFVITGDVHHFKNRNELKSYIESEGGRVSGSVSSATSFLINNDVNSSSGKNKKAKELNIPILSEEEFINRFCGNQQQPIQMSLF
jgi:DNA ligase (NAD+)